MTLEEQKIIIPRPVIPIILKGKIKIFANCYVKSNEIALFNQALQCVAKHLQHDNIDLSDYFVLNVLFTEDGSISFHEDDDRNNGSQIYMAIYRMKKLRKINANVFMLFVFIEELAHYYWRMYDETEIKYKVVEIINYIVPSLKIDDVKGWGLNGL
jgi:hypothetical protein